MSDPEPAEASGALATARGLRDKSEKVTLSEGWELIEPRISDHVLISADEVRSVGRPGASAAVLRPCLRRERPAEAWAFTSVGVHQPCEEDSVVEVRASARPVASRILALTLGMVTDASADVMKERFAAPA